MPTGALKSSFSSSRDFPKRKLCATINQLDQLDLMINKAFCEIVKRAFYFCTPGAMFLKTTSWKLFDGK